MTKKVKPCPKPKLKDNSYLSKKLNLKKNDQHFFSNEWVCDFETITGQTRYFKKYKKTGIVYGYLESMEYKDLNHEFNKMEDLFKFFMTRNNDQTVYFHNVSFDGVFIVDWLGRNHFKLSKDDSIGHSNKIFRQHRSTGNKIYMIDVTIRNDKGKLINIFFRCSYHILQRKVELLGNDIGLEKFLSGEKNIKGWYDREPCDTLQEFVAKNYEYCEYCKRDVKIVIQCLKEFYMVIYEFLEKLGMTDYFGGIKKCITIAAISLKLQTIMVEKEGYDVQDTLYLTDHKSWEIMDRFTNGGLTTSNLDWKEKEITSKGFVIDLKSAYPAVMAGKLPFGQMIYEEPIDYNDEDYCTFLEIHYDHIKAKNHNIPLLKNWDWDKDKNNFNNYETERVNYTTCLLKEEMERIEQLHEFTGKKILNKYYFKKRVFLTEFVDQMFFYKEHYKKLGQLAKSHAFKIGVNAAYGIHAKRPDYTCVKPKDWFNPESEKTYEINDRIHLNKEKHHSYIPNNEQFAYEPNNVHEWGIYSHKGIANYITAMTRCKLMDGIMYFGPNRFAYSDTDSLFLVNIEKDEILSYCGNQLGSWEIEKEFAKVQIMRAKLYKVWDKNGKLIKQGSAGVKDGQLVIFSDLLHDRKVVVKNAINVAVREWGGLVVYEIDKIISLADRKLKAEAKLKEQKEELKGLINLIRENENGSDK